MCGTSVENSQKLIIGGRLCGWRLSEKPQTVKAERPDDRLSGIGNAVGRWQKALMRNQNRSECEPVRTNVTILMELSRL